MIDYSVRSPAATRPFIVAVYVASEDGVLRPFRPDRCIDHEPGVACEVVFDHWRDRKTGPCFPIAVLRCLVHERGFTVYPPGHVPYGAVAVAAVDLEGHDRPGGDRTMFDAATDAAAGRLWRRETPEDHDPPGPYRWRNTQRRHLGRALGVLGLTGSTRDAEVAAAALDVDLLAVIVGRGRGRGCVAAGRALLALLERIGRPLLRRLLAAGHAAGLWGSPLW